MTKEIKVRNEIARELWSGKFKCSSVPDKREEMLKELDLREIEEDDTNASNY